MNLAEGWPYMLQLQESCTCPQWAVMVECTEHNGMDCLVVCILQQFKNGVNQSKLSLSSIVK